MNFVSKFRKVLYSFFFFCFAGITVSTAQVVIIPMAGLNLSKIKYDIPEGNTVPLTGYQVGANMRIGSGGFLQVGAFYHKYSNRFEGIDTTTLEAFSTDIKIDGVLIPIQFGFSIYNVDILKIKLMAGINIGIPTGMESNSLNLLKDDLKGSNIEIAVGFGFDIFRFVIDANFGFAMNDLFNDPSKNSGKNLYTLNVGYLIGKQ